MPGVRRAGQQALGKGGDTNLPRATNHGAFPLFWKTLAGMALLSCCLNPGLSIKPQAGVQPELQRVDMLKGWAYLTPLCFLGFTSPGCFGLPGAVGG